MSSAKIFAIFIQNYGAPKIMREKLTQNKKFIQFGISLKMAYLHNSTSSLFEKKNVVSNNILLGKTLIRLRVIQGITKMPSISRDMPQ